MSHGKLRAFLTPCDSGRLAFALSLCSSSGSEVRPLSGVGSSGYSPEPRSESPESVGDLPPGSLPPASVRYRLDPGGSLHGMGLQCQTALRGRRRVSNSQKVSLVRGKGGSESGRRQVGPLARGTSGARPPACPPARLPARPPASVSGDFRGRFRAVYKIVFRISSGRRG
jgi:hypothetical protein